MLNFKSTGKVKTVDSQNPDNNGNVETYRSITQAQYDALSEEEKHSGIVYYITDGATDHIAASSIRYDNSGTHIASSSVQGAIDALDTMLGSIDEGQLSDLEEIISSAEVVLDEVQPILPASSGTTGQVLTKTASGADWQNATGGGTVDSVNGVTPDGNKNVQIDVELTQSQYNALPATKNSDNINYYITDGIAGESSIDLGADAIVYDNTDSDLVATNAQDAIDENASAIEELSAGLIRTRTFNNSSAISIPNRNASYPWRDVDFNDVVSSGETFVGAYFYLTEQTDGIGGSFFYNTSAHKIVLSLANMYSSDQTIQAGALTVVVMYR